MTALAELREEATAFQRAVAEIERRAAELAGKQIAKGAELYRRETHLPHLLGHKALQWTDAQIADALLRSINAGRKSIDSGHWTANPTRVLALRQAYLAETGRMG